MEINTRTLGPIEIDEKLIINFVKPIGGVENGGSRYALLDMNPDSPVKLLQSVDDAHICFLVGDPAALVNDYVITPPAEELKDLSLEDEADAAVLVILTIMGDAAGMTTANLKAPIVVNRKSMKARQVVLGGTEFSMRYPLVLKK